MSKNDDPFKRMYWAFNEISASFSDLKPILDRLNEEILRAFMIPSRYFNRYTTFPEIPEQIWLEELEPGVTRYPKIRALVWLDWTTARTQVSGELFKVFYKSNQIAVINKQHQCKLHNLNDSQMDYLREKLLGIKYYPIVERKAWYPISNLVP